MKNIFNSISLKKPKRNAFDLTHDVKLSMKFGELVPVMVEEALPGDTFNISAETLVRFAPLVSPVMHRFNVFIHYFFVPNRLLWANWPEWIAGDDTLVPPKITIAGFPANGTRLTDYMGIPPITGSMSVDVNAMPFAAYQKIYDEYYRDQNLIDEVFTPLVDGSNMANFAALTQMRKRAWQHDYFTAALPFAQRGPAVDIPLGNVELDPDWASNGSQPQFKTPTGVSETGDLQNSGATDRIQVTPNTNQNAYDPDGSLTVQPTTITDLRRAFKLQEWLELSARAGKRSKEVIMAFFGVNSPDARLQRPEYITGVKSPVVISEVLNTTGETLPQGNMAGHGVSVAQGKFGKYYCQEHGYIIGIMSVMPLTAYQQGVPRHYLKTTDRYEYFWPQFAHIGEQEVKIAEIYAQTSDNLDTFGYVPRYAEYRFAPSRVAGDFRTTLNFWHLGRIFENKPELNQEFVECTPDTRIFAVEGDDDYLYCHVLNKVQAIRPIPKFGNPMM